MDDDANHSIFRPLTVRPVFLAPAIIETNHGVFHANAFGVDRDGHWIGVVNGMLAVGFECLGHRFGAVFLPQGIALFGIIAHGQGRLLAHFYSHGIPNELSA